MAYGGWTVRLTGSLRGARCPRELGRGHRAGECSGPRMWRAGRGWHPVPDHVLIHRGPPTVDCACRRDACPVRRAGRARWRFAGRPRRPRRGTPRGRPRCGLPSERGRHRRRRRFQWWRAGRGELLYPSRRARRLDILLHEGAGWRGSLRRSRRAFRPLGAGHRRRRRRRRWRWLVGGFGRRWRRPTRRRWRLHFPPRFWTCRHARRSRWESGRIVWKWRGGERQQRRRGVGASFWRCGGRGRLLRRSGGQSRERQPPVGEPRRRRWRRIRVHARRLGARGRVPWRPRRRHHHVPADRNDHGTHGNAQSVRRGRACHLAGERLGRRC